MLALCSSRAWSKRPNKQLRLWEVCMQSLQVVLRHSESANMGGSSIFGWIMSAPRKHVSDVAERLNVKADSKALLFASRACIHDVGEHLADIHVFALLGARWIQPMWTSN